MPNRNSDIDQIVTAYLASRYKEKKFNAFTLIAEYDLTEEDAETLTTVLKAVVKEKDPSVVAKVVGKELPKPVRVRILQRIRSKRHQSGTSC